MRPRRHRRGLVVFSSSVDPADRHGALQYRRVARTGRIRRWLRIGALLTAIAVRPRWKPLLAGVALTVFGVIERSGVGGVAIIPGLLLLWHALLIPGDSNADRERRSQLMRDLAAYSTTAQRCDLEATLDRYSDGVAQEIREILTGQDMAAHTNGIPGAGRY